MRYPTRTQPQGLWRIGLWRIGLTLALAVPAWCQTAPITIRATTMLDGKGAARRNVRIVIQGSKIVRVEPAGTGPVSYDLSGLTLMPGWIDTHVHIGGHFNKQGRA